MLLLESHAAEIIQYQDKFFNVFVSICNLICSKRIYAIILEISYQKSETVLVCSF